MEARNAYKGQSVDLLLSAHIPPRLTDELAAPRAISIGNDSPLRASGSRDTFVLSRGVDEP
jgi:hypothetical protein